MKYFAIILTTLFFVRPLLAQLELSDTLQVYEISYEGKSYSIFTINRTDRFAVSAYQEYLVEILLVGAREWYLGLHARQESFSNPEAIRREFTTGAESLHDGRSTFSIILEGKAQDIVHELVAQESILEQPEKFYRGMIRVSTSSYRYGSPPFSGRLGVLPHGFNARHNGAVMLGDWAELKNLAQDTSLKIDFLPLALRSIADSGWDDLGGHLRDRLSGEILRQGDPRLIDEKAQDALEIGDAYEMYHQRDIHNLVFGPDPERFENSKVGQYYLEVLVPESEVEGITDPSKAKGLLAYYYRQGFEVLSALDDPTQPNTKVVIAGLDRASWVKIIEQSRKRKGLELLKVPMDEINFENPNDLTVRQSSKIMCRNVF